MALFDFQMVKGFRKGTWFIFGFYSSHISQKVSRPWEGLQPIFRFWKWCFTQKCWGVRQKLNLKNRIGRQVTNVSAVDRACHRAGARTSRGHCSCTVDLSSTLLAGLAFFFSVFTLCSPSGLEGIGPTQCQHSRVFLHICKYQPYLTQTVLNQKETHQLVSLGKSEVQAWRFSWLLGLIF